MGNGQAIQITESESIDRKLMNAVGSALPKGSIFDYHSLIKQAARLTNSQDTLASQNMVEKAVELMRQQGFLIYVKVSKNQSIYVGRGDREFSQHYH